MYNFFPLADPHTPTVFPRGDDLDGASIKFNVKRIWRVWRPSRSSRTAEPATAQRGASDLTRRRVRVSDGHAAVRKCLHVCLPHALRC